MLSVLRRVALETYAKSLEREITDPPAHVAIIQDGNRRFATKRGAAIQHGHRAGAKTAERVLQWCRELGIEELTLYAFSTENFDRSREEREHLFDLLTEKLYEFADAEEIAEHQVRINVIGEVDRVPPRVQDAIAYAEGQTASFDRYRLNVAIAYGGRSELLSAARDVARAVEAGILSPDEIDPPAIDRRVYAAEVRNVDLIIRTGGDERTSNFLPWHANGNEAAVYFCPPYWPEFRKVDFLRAIRTYQNRERRWRRTRVQRAAALIRAFGDMELPVARAIAQSMRSERRDAAGTPTAIPSDRLGAHRDARSGSSDTAD